MIFRHFCNVSCSAAAVVVDICRPRLVVVGPLVTIWSREENCYKVHSSFLARGAWWSWWSKTGPDHNSSWRNVCPGFAWSAVLTSGLYRFAGRTLRRPTSITFLLHSTSPLQSSQTDQHNWCCVKTFLPALFLFLFPPFTIFFHSFSSLILGPV